MKSLDVDYLFFACSLSKLVGSQTVPLGCTVRFTGTIAKTGAKVTYSANYAPPTSLGNGGVIPTPGQVAQMSRVDFPNFKELSEVAIDIVSTVVPVANEEIAFVALDNINVLKRYA